MRQRLVFGMLPAVGLAALGTTWLIRFRLADAVVERKLAAAGVAGTYRLTRIGPFHERIEDVRIGNPAAPDLIAGRIDVFIGYGPVPEIRSIHAEHVRIAGRIGRAGLSLGALDRLLPQTRAARVALPNLDLSLGDAVLTLATPNGTLNVALNGAGNPQRDFRGRAVLDGPALRIASCSLARVRAVLRVEAQAGAPGAAGDVAIAGATCPSVAVGGGRIRLALRADRALRHVAGEMLVAGFPGRAGTARFANVSGPVSASGELGSLDLDGRISFASVVAPTAVRAAARNLVAPAARPLAPTMARASGAVARLLGRSDVAVDALLQIRGTEAQANVRRLELAGDDGARLIAMQHGGLSWSAAGLRLDADVATGGGDLPAVTLRLRQAAAGAPLAGAGSVAPYRAGTAALAIPDVRFERNGGRTRFAGHLSVDGPIGTSGMVRALEMPLSGRVEADGSFAVGEGCTTIGAGVLTIGSFRFADLALPLCGRPLIARSRSGAVRVAATASPLALRGRTADGAPVSVAAASVTVSGRTFALHGVNATLGAGDAPTRLAAASLSGTLDEGSPQGGFAGAAARIGAVPLGFTEGAGQWRLADGALHLAGALRIGDVALAPRFRTLAADDATLLLQDGRIRAAATLREPVSGAELATVDVAHDLASGSGQALLAVAGLRFRPKGLQPDAITPVTLGVIANVAGTVTAYGRIDWTARGVTSSGSVATERLDLAAAFGPVSGIRGSIALTDLLGLVSAPDQTVTVAEINPGVAIQDGVVRFALPGENRIAIAEARWPFARGTLRLAPTVLDLASDAERHLTFQVDGIDAGAFVQQLALPNLSATGTFDGRLPMIFGPQGGRIAGGAIAARAPGGTLAYVGELTTARLGRMGKLAFDALKAIRYSTLAIDLDGQLDGEMVSRVAFTGVREATPDQSLVARMIHNLPFRFNITIRAPFRGLLGTARSYADPALLLERQAAVPVPPVQPGASGDVR